MKGVDNMSGWQQTRVGQQKSRSFVEEHGWSELDELRRCNRRNSLQEVDGGRMTLARSDDRRTRCDNLLMLGLEEVSVVMTDLLVVWLLELQERSLVCSCQMLEGQRLGELVCSFPV